VRGPELEGSEVVCPAHGARFDLGTGKVTKNLPWLMRKMTNETRDLETYRIAVRDGIVSVDI
jgi:nitrite reductase/ring-hydroxylating ferredoxin subunit